jgi:ADP-heptose:LPS heptosyltransferase
VRIVVLRALKLGDFLTGLPTYRALRRAFPEDEIVLAAPRALAPLVALTNGAIDRIVECGELAPLAPELRDADVGVNLHGAGPQSHRLLLAARPRRLIAFRNEEVPASVDGAPFEEREHEVARWCRLLAHAGIPADPRELDLAVPPINVPRRLRGATLVHPGASSESRRWPLERWIAVARAEQRLDRPIVITGGPDEVERARAVAGAAGVPQTHVFAGRTSLRELAALVAAAGRVVCGDTGVAHLATAYRRPSVVLFGPIAPSVWGPPPRSYHRVLWSGTTGDAHADRVDPGLLAIPAERVIAALDALSVAAPANAS